MEELSLDDDNFDGSPVCEEQCLPSAEQTLSSQPDQQFEETLLHLAEILSEDESSGCEDVKQLRKRRASDCSIQASLKDQGTSTLKNKRRKKNKSRLGKSNMGLRPNYFVGIQVSNPEVHCAVRNLQEKIVGMQPSLRSTVIPTPMQHITLAVAHLPDPAHVAKAAEVMKESISANKDMYNNPPMCLKFIGVKTFKNQVLFADIEGGESLVRITGLAQAIEESFEESGLVMPSKKIFQPHLTILKLSKDFKLKRKGVLKILPSMYAEDKDMQFGQQVVKSVQLLSMYKPKDANGYYYCSHEEKFDVNSDESKDHSQCCEKPLLKQLARVPGGGPGLGEDIRRGFHSSATSPEEQPTPSVEDVIKMLLLVGAASIGAAFLLRSFSSAK